jgi:peroxiredoxin
VVSVTPDEDPKEAGAYAREVRATFPVVQDPPYAIFEKFGVEGTPSNIVIDRKGKVVAAIEGLNTKALDAAVASAMAAK